MKAGQIMATNVERAQPDDTLQAAASAMKVHNIGFLPVCDGDRLLGMVTDRDITVRAVAEGRDPASTRVHEVMTHDFICCGEDDDLTEVGRLMQVRQVRRIAVLDRNNKMVGVLSLSDLAAAGEDPSRIGEVLQAVTEPTVPL
jgi:CBS domain-containing protein